MISCNILKNYDIFWEKAAFIKLAFESGKMHLNSWWQQSWPKSNQRRQKQSGHLPTHFFQNQKENLFHQVTL
jgi:hypothetical protein